MSPSNPRYPDFPFHLLSWLLPFVLVEHLASKDGLTINVAELRSGWYLRQSTGGQNTILLTMKEVQTLPAETEENSGKLQWRCSAAEFKPPYLSMAPGYEANFNSAHSAYVIKLITENNFSGSFPSFLLKRMSRWLVPSTCLKTPLWIGMILIILNFIEFSSYQYMYIREYNLAKP